MIQKGVEITWIENGVKRRAVVVGYPGEVYDSPPKKMKHPIFVTTNKDFWLDLAEHNIRLTNERDDTQHGA